MLTVHGRFSCVAKFQPKLVVYHQHRHPAVCHSAWMIGNHQIWIDNLKQNTCKLVRWDRTTSTRCAVIHVNPSASFPWLWYTPFTIGMFIRDAAALQHRGGLTVSWWKFWKFRCQGAYLAGGWWPRSGCSHGWPGFTRLRTLRASSIIHSGRSRYPFMAATLWNLGGNPAFYWTRSGEAGFSTMKSCKSSSFLSMMFNHYAPFSY